VRRPAPLPTLAELTELAAVHGIVRIGVAPAEVLERARAELHRRAAAGLDGGMGFTYRNPDRSTDPRRVVAEAASVIVAARPYLAEVEPERPPGPQGRVARYAWVDHYAPLRDGLRAMVQRLRAAGERAVLLADDNSIVDREIAHRGGLGWFGKNANLLLPGLGSYAVLGCVVTTASYPVSSPAPDGCGTCTRCLPACPTGAIVAPGVIDANRCLAWLLQRPGTFPVEFREALGDRLYGCDDCQEACPPTVRLGPRHAVPIERDLAQPWVDVLELLESSDEDLLARHGRWYLADRDPRWWRRDALLVLGNVGDPDDPRTLAVLSRYAADPDPFLREHAEWAVERLRARARAHPVTVRVPVSVPSIDPSGSLP
jgi:epoxyqueuosine reductase